MNKQIITLLLLMPLAVAAQKAYRLSGTITGLKEPAFAYLDYGNTKDSVEIKNGKFTFNGTVPEPVQAFLAVKRASSSKKQGDYRVFWLENAGITVSARDSIKNAVVKGSASQVESDRLDGRIKPLTNHIIRLMKEADTKPAAERKTVVSDSIKLLVKQIKDIRTQFAISHPSSFMGLYVFNVNVLDSYVDPDFAENVFLRFSPALKTSPLGIRSAEKIEAAKRRQTGAKVTDFTQTDITDKPFTLSSLRGKYGLVDFWASWCLPCRAENPNLVKAYAALKDKNFEVVGVSLDQGKAAWEGAVKKDNLPWIHVSDLQGWNNAVAAQYGITAVPQNLLINPQGVIIGKNLRGEELTSKLNALIK